MSDPETSSTATDTDTATDTGTPDPRMLEELDEHIRDARAAAEDAVGYSTDSTDGTDGADGADSTEDDRTIDPPG